MKFLLAFLALFFASTGLASPFVANILIKEEVVKIENELLRLAVWRLKEEDVCHIEDMEPERDPTGMMLEAVSFEARKMVMDNAKVRTVYVHAKDMGEWKGDRENLTRDMKELCNGLPIRLVINTYISKEEFDNLTDGMNRDLSYYLYCGNLRTRSVMARSDSNKEKIIHRIVVSDSTSE